MPVRQNTLEELQLEVERLQGPHLTHVTSEDYAFDWRTFAKWCASVDLAPLPASPQTVALFVAHLLTKGLKVNSVFGYIAGVAWRHRAEGLPSPVDASVRRMLSTARRMRGEELRQMKPLTVVQLRRAAEALKSDTAIPARNRAILVFGFASALRRSSLSRLDLSDLHFCDEGILVSVRREKQDRKGEVRLLAVAPGEHETTCPVRAVRRWLRHRGEDRGPLFVRLDNARSSETDRLTPDGMAEIIKKSLTDAGISTKLVNSHSLRAGLITAAAVNGVPLAVIQQQSGHKTLEVLRQYIRPVELFRHNASKLVGL